MVTRKGKIHSWCKDCRRMVEASLTLTYDDSYMLVEDRSVCECGLVLWDWHWMEGPNIKVDPKPAKQMRLF